MKRRDFLKGITAIGAISAAPKLIASEPKAYYGTTELTEESLAQLLDEIGDEPIGYNWTEVYVNETGYHAVLKVEAGEDLKKGDAVCLSLDRKAYKTKLEPGIAHYWGKNYS